MRSLNSLMEPAFLQRLTVIAACLFSALLLASAQIFSALGWLTFLGFVPLCLVIKPQKFLPTWGILGFFYAVYTALTCSWLPHVGEGFGWFLLFVSVYSALFMVVPALGLWAVGSMATNTAMLLMLPATWVLCELLMRKILLEFSWTLFGLPLAEWPNLAQGASIGGPELLSFLVVATNVSIMLLVRPCTRVTKVIGILQGPALIILVVIWGSLRLDTVATDVGRFRIGVVQPNIPKTEKWDTARRTIMLARYDRLIDRVAQRKPDIIALPESAVAGYVRYESNLADWVKRVVIRTKLPFVFGSLDRNDDSSEHFISAIMVTPYDTVMSYRKHRLVPATEYVPALGPLMSLITRTRGGLKEFTAGQENTKFELQNGTSFSVLICWEDIFPDLARQHALTGANVLIALINTEAFGESSQASQHLRRAQLTAISVGVPLVRVANSGISSQIDRNGRILARLEDDEGKALMVAGTAVFEVQLDQRGTVYRKYGDTLMLALSILWIGSVIIGSRLRKTAQHW